MTYDPNRHRGNAFYDRALNAFFFCSTWRFSCLLTFSWFLSLSFSVLVSLRCFLGFPCCVWCRYYTALRMLSATIKHCYKHKLPTRWSNTWCICPSILIITYGYAEIQSQLAALTHRVKPYTVYLPTSIFASKFKSESGLQETYQPGYCSSSSKKWRP